MTYSIPSFLIFSKSLCSSVLLRFFREKGWKIRMLFASFLAIATVKATSQTLSGSEQQREYLEQIVRSATALRQGADPSLIAEGKLLDTGKCGTPLQVEMSRLWEQFSPQEKLQLLQVTSRPTLQTSKLSASGFFRIHYDTTGIDAPALLDALGQQIEGTSHAYADSVGSAFEQSREVEVNILGYPEPPSDGMIGGGAEYDIYIRNLGFMIFGQTWWAGEERIDTTRPNFTTQSYIEVDNDYQGYRTAGLLGLRVTAAHELHHAIQVGSYGLWANFEFYFYELSSTWMEEMVYDDINDYYFDLPRYLMNTGIPFNLWDIASGYYGYERSIWGLFLTERHGPIIMRRTWEEMKIVRSLDALERTLNEFGDSFSQSFVEFFLWNFFTGFRASGDRYYDEAANYPLVQIVSSIDLSSGTGRIANTSKPLAAHYHQVLSNRDTVTLVSVNRDIESANMREYSDNDYQYDFSTFNQGSAFLKLPNGIRVRFTVDDPALWQSMYLINNTIATEFEEVSNLYPNPFVLNGLDVLVIPIDDASSGEVTLHIFTSTFELVYSKTLLPTTFLGRIVVTWNGKNNDGVDVSSGIYFYAIESNEGTSKGKFAVIQQ